jgi:hypothetical protein
MSSSIEPKRSYKIDGAILALILTTIAYVAAFAYEDTYLSYFGIPVEFVDVTLRELLLCGAVTLLVMFAAIVFSTFFWELFLKSLPPVLSKIVFLFTSLAVGTTAFMLLAGNFQPAMIITAAIGPLLINCVLFAIPIFRFSHMLSYKRKLMATYAESSPSDSFKLPSFLWLPVSKGVFLLAAGTVASTMFAFAFGEFRARTQAVFPVSNPPEPCVVLRVSSEGYLCAAIDLQKRITLGSFKIIDPKSADVHIVRLGRIRPVAAQDGRRSEEESKAASEKPISPDDPIPREQK